MGAEGIVKIDEVRHFGTAGPTPDCPKIEQDVFAAKIFEAERAAVERFDFKVGGEVAGLEEDDHLHTDLANVERALSSLGRLAVGDNDLFAGASEEFAHVPKIVSATFAQFGAEFVSAGRDIVDMKFAARLDDGREMDFFELALFPFGGLQPGCGPGRGV